MPSERSPTRLSSKVRDKDEDRKLRGQLPDAVSLEIAAISDSKPEANSVSQISARKGNEPAVTTDPAGVPRSRSHFQHEGRGSTAQDGRCSGGRMILERERWKDFREKDQGTRRTAGSDSNGKERSRAQTGDTHVLRHDRLSDAKNVDPPAKKRRQFREEKLPPESEPMVNAGPDSSKDPHALNATRDSGRWEERDRSRRPLERSDYGRARPFSRGERPERVERTDIPSSSRFNGGKHDNRYRGRDAFHGRQTYQSSGGREEKWKHDLFDETNRSPAKNEDDPVAKVEALLSL